MIKPALGFSIALSCLVHAACSEDGNAATTPDASDNAMKPDGGAKIASVGAFCDAYEAACGFGRDQTFSDREDCEEDFADKFDESRKRCAAEHLELAEDDPDSHCEAAKGDQVCRQ